MIHWNYRPFPAAQASRMGGVEGRQLHAPARETPLVYQLPHVEIVQRPNMFIGNVAYQAHVGSAPPAAMRKPPVPQPISRTAAGHAEPISACMLASVARPRSTPENTLRMYFKARSRGTSGVME